MAADANYGADWTQLEVEAVVVDYLSMLAGEITGKAFNKAEHNRNLQKLIGRTRGAIEFKHQNISAILFQLNLPWIQGYKRAENYQTLLREVVVEQVLGDRGGVRSAIEVVVSAEIMRPSAPTTFACIQVPVPRTDHDFSVQQPARSNPVPRLRNYVEIDARNRALGSAGEEFVVEFEKRRLHDGGCKKLAAQVDHVAATQGDGLGYDVQSFEFNGQPRLIEVKTTSFGELTQFYVSNNEVSTSERLAANFQLYRLFNFKKSPQFFALPGSLRKSCYLEPDQFKARLF